MRPRSLAVVAMLAWLSAGACSLNPQPLPPEQPGGPGTAVDASADGQFGASGDGAPPAPGDSGGGISDVDASSDAANGADGFDGSDDGAVTTDGSDAADGAVANEGGD